MKKKFALSKKLGTTALIVFLLIIFVFVTGFNPLKNKCKDKHVDDNIDHVMAYFNAIDNEDADAIASLFSDDAVQEFVGNDPIVGSDAIAQQLNLAFAQMDTMQTQVLDVIAGEDMVAVHVRHVATFAAGGAIKSRVGIFPPIIIFKEPTPITWQAMVTFKCADGKIIKEIIVRDDLSILMQVGTVSIETP